MTFPAWEFPTVEQYTWPLLETDPRLGPIQRSLKWGGAAAGKARLRRWRTALNVGAASEKDLIRAEFNTARGDAGSTTFVPPGAALPIAVRFVSSSLRWRRVSAARYLTEVEVEELREGLTS